MSGSAPVAPDQAIRDEALTPDRSFLVQVITGIKADEEGETAERDAHFADAAEWAKVRRSEEAGLSAGMAFNKALKNRDAQGMWRYLKVMEAVGDPALVDEARQRLPGVQAQLQWEAFKKAHPETAHEIETDPEGAPEKQVQPAAPPADTPPKDSEERQGGGPEAKSELPSPE